MNESISFWDLIKSQKISICVPRIQRDYAQGRVGKELLRKRLLLSIKDSLDNTQELSKHLLLDFVYGSIEKNGVYYPLDGQQRLTTLWLLHWFIAYKAKKLNEVCSILKQFRYETRRSAADFCEFLCELTSEQDSNDLRTYITSQTKFASRWTLDPTVSAMLNTLCGTNIIDQDQQDIVDGFSELFKECDDKKFNEYWKILTHCDCPIRFFNLNMRDENLPLSDDLYIKMNARGQQLSDWENFKADLLEFMDGKIDNLDDEIDNRWTNLFWLWHHEGKIDDILFAFVNRYIFNEFLCTISNEDIANHSLYRLYGGGGDDRNLKYEDFSIYTGNQIIAEITKNAIKKLCGCLQKISSVQDVIKDLGECVQSNWPNSDPFSFLPGGDKITLNQRLVFLAICRYFEKVDHFDKEKFQDWIRFTWNISEYIRTDAMVNAFVFINGYASQCGDILQHLASMDVDKIEARSFASEQLIEEIEKAKYIVNEEGDKGTLLEVERYKNLHGNIGFLFHNATGQVDWNNFITKYNNLKNLFEGTNTEVKDKFKDNKIFKLFLSYCNSIGQIVSWTNNSSYLYDYTWEHWRSNFTNKKYALPTHMVLMSKEMKKEQLAIKDFEENAKENCISAIYKVLLQTNLVELVAERLSGSYLRKYKGKYCLYPSAEGINMEREKRDRILTKLTQNNMIEIADSITFNPHSCEQRIFYKGWNIPFKYQNISFEWTFDDRICIPDTTYGEDVKEHEDHEEIIKVLESLKSLVSPL